MQVDALGPEIDTRSRIGDRAADSRTATSPRRTLQGAMHDRMRSTNRESFDLRLLGCFYINDEGSEGNGRPVRGRMLGQRQFQFVESCTDYWG